MSCAKASNTWKHGLLTLHSPLILVITCLFTCHAMARHNICNTIFGDCIPYCAYSFRILNCLCDFFICGGFSFGDSHQRFPHVHLEQCALQENTNGIWRGDIGLENFLDYFLRLVFSVL